MKRNSTEQIYAVLEALNHDSLQITHLAYRTNLNCIILHDILKALQSKGYAEVSGFKVIHPLSQKTGKTRRQRPRYRLTVEGKEFYRKIEQTFSTMNNLLALCDQQKYISQAQSLKIS